MTTINTIDDLLRIVRENEEYRAALRKELLTDELLALPAQFVEMRETQNMILAEQEDARKTRNQILAHIDELRETQNDLRATQNQMLAHIDELRETQNELRATQNEMRATQNEMRETQNQMLAHIDELRETQNEMRETQNKMLVEQEDARNTRSKILDHINELRETQNKILRRLDNVEAHNMRLSNDFGAFRGNYAESAAVKSATDIAIMLNESKSLGIDETLLKVLSRDDLRALARGYGPEKLAAIPLGERRSFYKADVVIEATKLEGTKFYIAAQASFTCGVSDADRALAHAELLTKFTGKEAWPVIAGVRIDSRIQSIIDDRKVFWYSLEESEMSPVEPC